LFAFFRRAHEGSAIRLGRHHLRSASGAVERATGQASHLGVAAFACVFAEDVWRKGDYLRKRPQDDVVEGAAAGVAAG